MLWIIPKDIHDVTVADAPDARSSTEPKMEEFVQVVLLKIRKSSLGFRNEIGFADRKVAAVT